MDQSTGLYEIYGLWHVPFWQTRWFLISSLIFGFLILATMVGVIIIAVRSKKKVVTPEEYALIRLHNLLKLRLSSAEERYRAYDQLIGIIKEYLSFRYKGAAKAMTDDEILAFLAAADCPASVLNLLFNIFKGSTEIRFAAQEAPDEIVRQAIETAVVIVQETTPEPSNS